MPHAVVIEHKTTDWVINVDPEGGNREIVAWVRLRTSSRQRRAIPENLLDPVLKKARKPKRRSTSEAAE